MRNHYCKIIVMTKGDVFLNYFARVPSVGEYITFQEVGHWYEVKSVFHRAVPASSSYGLDAELYVEQ